MSTVEEIEVAISRLEPSEYDKFRQWLSEYDNRKWDQKLDEDSRSGRLDDLAQEALKDLQDGRCTEL
jgi:hypothetical protein